MRRLEAVVQQIQERLGMSDAARAPKVRTAIATAPTARKTATAATADTLNVEEGFQLVKTAYLQVTGGKKNQYVRLADLRPILGELPRDFVDWLLKRLQQQEEAILYPIDDPQRYAGRRDAAALRQADSDACLMVSGERRDLFLLR